MDIVANGGENHRDLIFKFEPTYSLKKTLSSMILRYCLMSTHFLYLSSKGAQKVFFNDRLLALSLLTSYCRVLNIKEGVQVRAPPLAYYSNREIPSACFQL